ncbi:TetR/AcrR family transcriptional regulator [Paenibacillus sp. MBLB4367]|uniref:TetR/AcrR family transcriptional regulator n=1 Tax=Paenibacillus sp. MBLB4367 TaxID=3384767 RepID=UPI003907E8DA
MSIRNKKDDPRVKRTRQLLNAALIALIRDKGYEKITVQDLAERAGLNRATFYLHYNDKHDLTEQSTDEIMLELGDRLRTAGVSEDMKIFDFRSDKPHPTFVHLFEHVELHADYYKVMLIETRMPYFTSRLINAITEFISTGLLAVQPDDRLLTAPRDMLVRYTAAAFVEVIVWWLENDTPYSPKFMSAKLMKIAIYGPYAADPFA